ncbi:uncharacterized protein LOC117340857 [Pecten maximus]|uniref:uncharacterized protein LOC117340857 n=1 Tax=Pecten maximus TaxID=6579 RepID=UPI0014583E4D|nr:uncharacterized protein LOC117340857 [Pecten maximus]
MNGFLAIVFLLGLVCQSSTKQIPGDNFPGFSGEGSGEVEDAVTERLSLTTAVKILNEDNNIDDTIPSTSAADDEILIDETTTTVRHDPSVDVAVTPTKSGDVTPNQEAIIVLIVVVSVLFFCIVVLVVVVLLRKRSTGTPKMVTIYRKF